MVRTGCTTRPAERSARARAMAGMRSAMRRCRRTASSSRITWVVTPHRLGRAWPLWTLLGNVARSISARPVSSRQLRQTIRQYDLALKRGDAAAVDKFWADEYIFVNPTGQRLTKAARMANLRASRTTFDTVAPQLEDERGQ
ncbi:MAG: nuclear transport factor 2 family protein [Gemmatimonadales bacterium]